MENFNQLQRSSLSCWHLGDPSEPILVGEVRLSENRRDCVLEVEDQWFVSGIYLTPDMADGQRHCFRAGDLRLPGTLDDAIPDQWGQRMIRTLWRPSRMSVLDILWYAGDRRFGALGISSSAQSYTPHEEPPLLKSSSIAEASEVIQRVMLREPLTDAEREMIASAGSMGGAHPKMLVEHNGSEWIAKFPKGHNVDQLLIEHASMELARRSGLNVADSMVLSGGIDHILLVRRFDREGDRRRHAISARTMLVREGDDSYATISGMIRKHGPAAAILEQQVELYRRMVFNIMIDNTDDHTKNHAFMRSSDGSWNLSPAYDIPPQMNGLGVQAIQISTDPFQVNKFSREHAVAAAAHFGLSALQAEEEWNRIAGNISLWKEVFSEVGVTPSDIDYLSDFLDSDTMLEHRRDAILPTPRPGF